MFACDSWTQARHAMSLSCLLALAAPAATSAQEAPPRPFLRKVIQLDDAQLAAMEKGEVVTKMLPTTDKAEIAAFGVVKAIGTVDKLLNPRQRRAEVPAGARDPGDGPLLDAREARGLEGPDPSPRRHRGLEEMQAGKLRR